MGPCIIDQSLTFYCNTHDGLNGVIDADSPPIYRVYEKETSTPILTGTMAKLDDSNTVGLYSEEITLSAANGFEVGKSYLVRILATIGGVDFADLQTFDVIATPIAAGAAMTLTSGERTSIGNALLALIVDGSYSVLHTLRVLFAAHGGKTSGNTLSGASTPTVRNPSDTKNVIAATVDANGNRTGVTIDAT